MITFAEASAVYECLTDDPCMRYSSIARFEGWRMATGLPYHVKVERIVAKLEKLGCLTRERQSVPGSATKSSMMHSLIRPPVAEEFGSRPVNHAPSKSRGVHLPGRYLRTAGDCWILIRRIASIARKLPQSSRDFGDEQP